jgi:radical SAM/Cys-rich protein
MAYEPISLDGTEALLGLDLTSLEAGPKRARTLLSRQAPLVAPAAQLEVLDALTLTSPSGAGDFDGDLARHGWAGGLRPSRLEIFQINVGKLCNMTCRHCHVDAGPDRVHEMMTRETAELCVAVLERSGAHTVDLTGGAPELNPHFRYLVDASVALGKHVIDRCNLTVLLLPRYDDLPGWLADRGVEVVCSLPHYRQLNTDAQRGDGTYRKSIEALRRLNAVGYGQGDPGRILTLMTNPAGAYLPSAQSSVQAEWKAALERNHGVTFDRLIALSNMPIARFLEWLLETGNLQAYMQRLTNAFNPAAVAGLMCRNTVSVSWDGRVFDCDFNQMLELETQYRDGRRAHLSELDLEAFLGRRIVTRRHCYGCTAGAGSSCGGATA